ncbi:MAG TPA: hypothetical protein VGG48_12565 [Rhizomicrobium sp.]|jgi:tetratricopeptide (TPR) repeat protein
MFINLAVLALATFTTPVADLPQPAACANYDKPGAGEQDCDAGIAAETDPHAKSMLLFRRAFLEDAGGDFSKFPAAIADLTEAIRLFPENRIALHERGYLYNAQGRWAEAAADLDRVVAIAPNWPEGYNERAVARFELGDLAGTYADRDAQVRLEPDNAAAILARASAELWLGRFEDVARDIDAGAKVAVSQSDKDFAVRIAKELAAWRTTSGAADPAASCNAVNPASDISKPGLFGDCTRAFLDAHDNAARAQMLTGRAMVSLLANQDEETSRTDSQIAVALDPGNAHWHSNLAFAYIRAAHSTAAVEEFSKAIAIAPEFYLYGGRAAAYYNLRRYAEALADAQKSFEMKPNDLALTVLGDLAYEQRHDSAAAKTFWMDAYQLGDRDDGLIGRLKKVGVDKPDAEPKP